MIILQNCVKWTLKIWQSILNTSIFFINWFCKCVENKTKHALNTMCQVSDLINRYGTCGISSLKTMAKLTLIHSILNACTYIIAIKVVHLINLFYAAC